MYIYLMWQSTKDELGYMFFHLSHVKFVAVHRPTWDGVALQRPTLAARTISTILKFSQPFGFINGCVGYQIEAYDVLYKICSQHL